MVGVCKATEFSVDLMIQTRLKSGLVSYEEMAMGLYNEKIANAVAVAILVMTFGASVAFILAVGDILEAGVLDVFGGSLSRQNLMVIFWALFMLPLSILENMNSLRFFSGFGVLNSFYLVFATTLHAIHHFSEKGFPNFSNDSSASLWPSSLNGVIEACPILIFAYICQINIFSLFEELKDGTAEKFATVTRGGIAAISSFYFLLATFTFLEFGDKTQDNILTNYCVAKNPEPLMVVAYVGYALTITMAYPMCTFPCRYTVHVLLHRLFGTRERHYDSIPKMGKSRRVMISTIISCGSVLTALVAPGISSVFGIVGGTAASFICFILPAMFAIKLKLAEKWSPQYIYTSLVFFGGISIGLLSTIITVNAAISRKVKPESPCSS
uniref:Amino acid transporter transmembrane domain-containing protein n=1 Tax=Corethron hystrix TaxID=216773 RepID=A0A7S1C2U9_9STRA|mmetsp:Transcript_9951/g.22211  ORF Transcript_9951/g.22211 Transcript_9951/m.22211 type:complete len:383 (+) Transcript_9951:582-1730(+)